MFKTRIAPSPSGNVHIGNIRTAYFNWLAARASGGTFSLRIDDTDAARSKPEYTQVILDTLDWLGLNYDQIIHQSKCDDLYRNYAQYLEDQDCLDIVESAIVLRLPDKKWPETWHDELVGDIRITEDDITNCNGMVLFRADGSVTYNFASVVNDIDMGINYVIRGVDHTSNTAKQVMLYSLLNYPVPKYAHVGLIHKDKKPLSKRDDDSSMLSYRDKGYDPDAMLNFLARLGWGPTVDDKTTKTLPRERMIELFLTGGKMRPTQANMDIALLDAFDRKYKAKKLKGDT